MNNQLKSEINNFYAICDFISDEPIGKAIMNKTGNSIRKIFAMDCARIAMLPSHFDSKHAENVSSFLFDFLSVRISADMLRKERLDSTAIQSNIVNRIPDIVKIFVDMDKNKSQNDNVYFSLVAFQVFVKICQGILDEIPLLQSEVKNYILSFLMSIKNYISNTLKIDVDFEVC